MNVLQKGGLTVIAGTAIASVLIMMTGNNTTVKSKNILDQEVSTKALNKENTLLSTSTNTDITSIKDSENKVATVMEASTAVVSKPRNLFESDGLSSNIDKKAGTRNIDQQGISSLLPPPGPFIEGKTNLSVTQDSNMKSMGSPTPPRMPKAPVQQAQERLIVSPNVSSLEKPLSTSVIPSEPKFSLAPKMGINTPVMAKNPPNQAVSSSAVSPVQGNPAPKPSITTLMAPPRQPVWMLKNPIPPSTRNKPQKLEKQSIVNKQKSFLTQRYMVVPAPMYAPNYNYRSPQMPMYGGANYYAPTPPQYMMPFGRQLRTQKIQPKAMPAEGNNVK